MLSPIVHVPVQSPPIFFISHGILERLSKKGMRIALATAFDLKPPPAPNPKSRLNPSRSAAANWRKTVTRSRTFRR
jgi:hypothetical protein